MQVDGPLACSVFVETLGYLFFLGMRIERGRDGSVLEGALRALPSWEHTL